MEYGIPKPGSTLVHEDMEYPQCKNYEEAAIVIELGLLLSVDEIYEVWVFDNKVAIIPNEMGILE